MRLAEAHDASDDQPVSLRLKLVARLTVAAQPQLSDEGQSLIFVVGSVAVYLHPHRPWLVRIVVERHAKLQEASSHRMVEADGQGRCVRHPMPHLLCSHCANPLSEREWRLHLISGAALVRPLLACWLFSLGRDCRSQPANYLLHANLVMGVDVAGVDLGVGPVHVGLADNGRAR